MARSRRTPLFEVMRETDRMLSSSPPAPARRSDPPSPVADRGVSPVRVFPRITTPETPPADPSSPAAQPLAGHHDTGAAPLPRRSGVFVSYAGLWIAGGVAALLLAIVAISAYRAGAEDEKNKLLAARQQSPPDDSDAAGTQDPTDGSAREPAVPRSHPAGAPSDSNAAPTSPALPVLGEDPRQRGWNYLVVATLFRNDAAAVAQFVTDNGVPCVVVAPEGKSPDALLQDRRANWLVIAREGLSGDDYRSAAGQARRTAIERRVKQIGLRWKQDMKGTSDLRDCFWDKFGK